MKKTLITLVTAAGIALSSLPAKADNRTGLIIGGIIGGLIVGEIIRDSHRNHRNYNRHEPRYLRSCYTQWVEYYDSRRGYYVRQPREVCYMVKQ